MKKLGILMLTVFMAVAVNLANCQLFGGDAYEYQDTFRISDVQLQDGTMTGTMQNLSQMPISMAEATVFFLDENGQVVDQATLTMVDQNAVPLQPDESREFMKNVTVPQNWDPQTGEKDIKITAIEFEAQQQMQEGAPQEEMPQEEMPQEEMPQEEMPQEEAPQEGPFGT